MAESTDYTTATDHGKEPYVVDIEKVTLENTDFRSTLWTGKHLQLTVMSIPVGDDVGLEVHEGPTLSARSEGDLRAGNVVSVEPGVYLPGRFGVRIEDLVAVTDSGADVLTTMPKELTTVD